MRVEREGKRKKKVLLLLRSLSLFPFSWFDLFFCSSGQRTWVTRSLLLPPHGFREREEKKIEMKAKHVHHDLALFSKHIWMTKLGKDEKQTMEQECMTNNNNRECFKNLDWFVDDCSFCLMMLWSKQSTTITNWHIIPSTTIINCIRRWLRFPCCLDSTSRWVSII